MNGENRNLKRAIGAVAITGALLAGGLHVSCWILLQQFSVIYADMFKGHPLPAILAAKSAFLILESLVPLGIGVSGFFPARPERKLCGMAVGMGLSLLLFLFVWIDTLSILGGIPQGLGQSG